MPAVPPETPVTTPEKMPIVATDELLLNHEPPDTPLVKVAVAPTHKAVVPLMADGAVLMIMFLVAKQPPANVYDIVTEPALTPETTPVEAPTVATAALLLVHEPPEAESAREAVLPVQINDGPVMMDGRGLTVRTTVAVPPVVA